jgi:hypothetical protein
MARSLVCWIQETQAHHEPSRSWRSQHNGWPMGPLANADHRRTVGRPGLATLVIGVATLVAAISFVLFPLGPASASGQPGRGSAVS